jgi:aspartate/methionine/tyrosine aminotransferase
LAALCRRQGLTVLADEVYREIIYEGRAESLAQFYERTVVINSLSKTYSMTGWRLGWCIGPPELIRTVIIFNQLAISCPPTICQRAAILALQGVGDLEKAANLEELRRRRDLAAQCLERYAGLKCLKPRGTFYLYIDISPVLPPSRTSWDVALDLIAKEKVVAIPGVAFGRAAENSLRLSFAATPENIEEGIRRIGRFFGRA